MTELVKVWDDEKKEHLLFFRTYGTCSVKKSVRHILMKCEVRVGVGVCEGGCWGV